MQQETALCGEEQAAPVDMLREIFLRQAAFRRRVNDKHDSLSARDWEDLNIHSRLAEYNLPTVEAGVQKYALCLLMEASELMDWTRWKHWSSRLGNKKDIVPGSVEHIEEMRMECADLLCFLVNACIELGMTPEILNAIHAAKVEINHQRQDSVGY